jgi:hypothetical protein
VIGVRIAAWVAQPLLIGFAVWLALGGRALDLARPLAFSGEALFFLAQAKGTLDHGWWWTNPSLGAPSTHRAVPLPMDAPVYQGLVKLSGLLTSDVFVATNMAWLMMLLASGATASWCLRRLGISRAGAWTAGVLFALSPYALYHNTMRPNLATYLIPFVVTIAWKLSADGSLYWHWRGSRVLLVGTLLLGLTGLDYAAFGICTLVFGAVIGAAADRRATRLAAGLLPVGLIVVGVTVSLAPNWMLSRRPDERVQLQFPASDSETYGFKIRQFVSPAPDHWLPPLRGWASRQERAVFPLETQNTGSRAGLVAAVGFLGLLVAVLVPSIAKGTPNPALVLGGSRLALAVVLLGTIGGAGSLLAVLTGSSVGPYTRVTPFVIFLALGAVAIFVDHVAPRRRKVAWAFIVVFGVCDQTIALRPVAAAAPSMAAEVRQLHEIVGRFEQGQTGASVFQLPIRPYPHDGGVARLAGFDPFKPYLVSHGPRWSYPATSRSALRWQEAIAQVAPRDLPERLARDGFAFILVDKYGYDDGGQSVLAGLQTIENHALLVRANDRYAALDLRFALKAR